MERCTKKIKEEYQVEDINSAMKKLGIIEDILDELCKEQEELEEKMNVLKKRRKN